MATAFFVNARKIGEIFEMFQQIYNMRRHLASPLLFHIQCGHIFDIIFLFHFSYIRRFNKIQIGSQ